MSYSTVTKISGSDGVWPLNPSFMPITGSVGLTGPVTITNPIPLQQFVTASVSNFPAAYFVTASVPGPVAVTQHVVASTLNFTTGNLAAGASYTGSAENTLGVAAIQINWISDQPSTLTIDQGYDGLTWPIIDTWYRDANQGSGRTFQAVSNYFRVREQNTGASAQMTHLLNVAMCPIVEALPRSLTQLGNLRSACVESTELNAASQGILFSVVKEASNGSVANVPWILVRNPATNTLDLCVEKIIVNTVTPITQTNGAVNPHSTCRVWVAPTVTTTGSNAVVPINRRRKSTGNSPASSAEVWSVPTISASGSEIACFGDNGATMIDDFDGGLILGPGRDLLVGIQQSTTSIVSTVTLVWTEIKTN